MQSTALFLCAIAFAGAPLLPFSRIGLPCDLETRMVGGAIQYRCSCPEEIVCNNCGVEGYCVYYGDGLHYCNCEGTYQESRDNCYTKIDGSSNPPTVFCIDVCCAPPNGEGICPTYNDSPWPGTWTEFCNCTVQ